ncbi:hypothetical protein CLOSTMETH_02206 [[Clostridium] methylpentosum DSM 5476]|uniref:Uncharacterized protein n=1 Tax=[Clostridium] methylpentosum DSM 5476 TaxID=537013 RepID=C0EEC6_9FIRM|nr:hypothetical protein CLOSTMETH_02206 [[Clostridium] methylpentosum DSM 5476]
MTGLPNLCEQPCLRCSQFHFPHLMTTSLKIETGSCRVYENIVKISRTICFTH